jgi:ankyrin repeat protein
MAVSTCNKIAECLRKGDLAELKAFIKANPTSARDSKAVVEAGRLGWKEALELLKRNGADLNASTRNYRALHSLIQEAPHAGVSKDVQSRVKCLKWLLANGADPEQLGAWPSMRAMLVAAFVGEPAYVAELKNAGARIDGFVSAALGDLGAVKKALKKPGFATARDSGGLTALHCCAGSRMGSRDSKVRAALTEIARLLLDEGADPNALVRSWGHSVDPVYFAVSSKQGAVLALLLEHGADPSAALVPAVWKNNIEFAELAMRHGGDINEALDEGKPVLNQMIRWGQVKQTLWLLSQGANPNIPDEQGWTAVHQAASRGNERLMKAVLEAGGDLQQPDREGNTPVDVALIKGRTKMIALVEG